MIHGFVDMHVGHNIFPNTNKKNTCQEACGPPKKETHLPTNPSDIPVIQVLWI